MKNKTEKFGFILGKILGGIIVVILFVAAFYISFEEHFSWIIFVDNLLHKIFG